MTAHKPRSRMISVRLCEDEYQALQHLCAVHGAQSVSDFAREAMQAHLNDLSSANVPQNGTNEFEVQLGKLDQKIEELFKVLMSSIAELKN
jgi:predicted DNA-binding protein